MLTLYVDHIKLRHGNIADRLENLKQLTSMRNKDYSQRVLDSDVVPHLVQIMDEPNTTDLMRQQIAWIFTNLSASDTLSENSRILYNRGVVETLLNQSLALLRGKDIAL